jgi:two-component system, OmpR family, phosphate regulon sensor histidine kinase PhoR
MTFNTKPNPRFFFYLLIIYIFASFAWWSYLMFQKNSLLFKAQVRAAQLEYNTANNLKEGNDSFFSTEVFQRIEQKYKSQKRMIIGEGAVFMILLTFGAVQLIRTFDKEVLLAKQQNNFLLSVTHEFKTPLASIKLSLQTLARRIAMEEKFQKLVGNSLDDVERLQGLVDNILFAARMENSSYIFQRVSHNISDLITGFIDKLKTLPGGSRIIVNRIEPDLEYDVDKEALFSAIVNLVENALKYSPDDKQVFVSLVKQNGNIIFEVQDEGMGIAGNEKHKIFDKFYRIGHEETRNKKGTGLGLFIAKRIVESHNGRLMVSDNQPAGSIFRIVFPA